MKLQKKTPKYFCATEKVRLLVRKYDMEARVLPIKTVGVQGDERTYEWLAILNGTRDWEKIRQATKEIPMQIPEINRVAYNISSEPLAIYPRGIIPTQVTAETYPQLKKIDAVIRRTIDEHGFTPNIAQTIIALLGSDMYKSGKRSVLLRAVQTDDFMTVSPVQPLHQFSPDAAMTWDCLDKLYELIKPYNVGGFMIDVTDKPPATTCLE